MLPMKNQNLKIKVKVSSTATAILRETKYRLVRNNAKNNKMQYYTD